jgi:cytochrome c biogenesis protein CcmG, thiol:disulfide interchange protein DsbE
MKSIVLTPTTRILSVAILLMLTLLYSNYQKNILFKYNNDGDYLILKELPKLDLVTVYDNELITTHEIYTPDTKGVFVHLWATWCAPCEAELPHFIKFANSYQNKDIKFLLIAVNDDSKKIKKFLKTIPAISANIILTMDEKGISQNQMGTVKVPETYLFNKQGKHIKKFVGPQNWGLADIQSYVNTILGK